METHQASSCKHTLNVILEMPIECCHGNADQVFPWKCISRVTMEMHIKQYHENVHQVLPLEMQIKRYHGNTHQTLPWKHVLGIIIETHLMSNDFITLSIGI